MQGESGGTARRIEQVLAAAPPTRAHLGYSWPPYPPISHLPGCGLPPDRPASFWSNPRRGIAGCNNLPPPISYPSRAQLATIPSNLAPTRGAAGRPAPPISHLPGAQLAALPPNLAPTRVRIAPRPAGQLLVQSPTRNSRLQKVQSRTHLGRSWPPCPPNLAPTRVRIAPRPAGQLLVQSPTRNR